MLSTLLVLLLQTSTVEAQPLINPNTSTKAELMAADKAITSEIADNIIAGRPYNSYRDVQKVIGVEVWDRLFNFRSYSPPPPNAKRPKRPINPDAPPLRGDVG